LRQAPRELARLVGEYGRAMPMPAQDLRDSAIDTTTDHPDQTSHADVSESLRPTRAVGAIILAGKGPDTCAN